MPGHAMAAMQNVRWRWLLACCHLAVAMVLHLLAHIQWSLAVNSYDSSHQRAAFIDSPYYTPTEAVVASVNFPALIVSRLIDFPIWQISNVIGFRIFDYPGVEVLRLDNVMFFVCIFAFWFFVGVKLERRAGRPISATRMPKWFLILLSVSALLLFGALDVLAFRELVSFCKQGLCRFAFMRELTQLALPTLPTQIILPPAILWCTVIVAYCARVLARLVRRTPLGMPQ